MGRTAKPVTGFRSRSGRTFRAKLKLEQDEEGKWRVEFDEEWAKEPPKGEAGGGAAAELEAAGNGDEARRDCATGSGRAGGDERRTGDRPDQRTGAGSSTPSSTFSMPGGPLVVEPDQRAGPVGLRSRGRPDERGLVAPASAVPQAGARRRGPLGLVVARQRPRAVRVAEQHVLRVRREPLGHAPHRREARAAQVLAGEPGRRGPRRAG